MRILLLTAFSIMPSALAAADYFPGNVVFHDWDILRYYWYYIWVHYTDYPFVVRVAFFIILLSALMVAVIVLIWNIIYLQHRKRDRYKRLMAEKCDPDLTRMFLNPGTATSEQIEETVRRIVPANKKLKYWRSRLWVEYMVNLRTVNPADNDEREVIDDQNVVLNMIYDALNLDTYVEHVVHFMSEGRKIALLDAMKFLGIPIQESLLSRLVNNKHAALRLNARLMYMHSAVHNTYRYLEEGRDIHYTTAIGMELHELFMENVRLNREKPAFTAMIYKQSDVKMKAFLTIEKAFWGTFDYKFISEMLKYPNVECRYGAIVACGIFKRAETEPDLIAMYDDQNETLKCEILKTLSKINSGKQAGFFLSAYEQAISDMSREIALQCLWTYNAESRVMFNQLEAQASEKERKIFSHVKNPMIMDNIDFAIQFNHERSA